MYRPQFPFQPAPEGFKWVPIIYGFDATNIPALAVPLAAGQQSGDIALVLNADSDFYWFATRIAATPLEVQFRDPFTNPLSDDFVPAGLIADIVQPTDLEPPGLFCPKGSAIWVRLKN